MYCIEHSEKRRRYLKIDLWILAWEQWYRVQAHSRLSTIPKSINLWNQRFPVFLSQNSFNGKPFLQLIQEYLKNTHVFHLVYSYAWCRNINVLGHRALLQMSRGNVSKISTLSASPTPLLNLKLEFSVVFILSIDSCAGCNF